MPLEQGGGSQQFPIRQMVENLFAGVFSAGRWVYSAKGANLCAVSQADTPAFLTLPVTVRDRNGAPLAGVRLTLQPSGHSVMTDARGAAILTGLLSGKFTVSLAPAGYYPLSLSITLAANAESSLDFTLEKGGTSSVRTHNATGGSRTFFVPPVPIPINPPPECLLTPPVPPGSGPAWRTAQEDALREATFRYLFTTFPFSASRHYRVVYLSLGFFPWGGQGDEKGRDPDAAFLRRFRGSIPPVLPVSALPASGKDWENPAKRHWIIYRVSSFQWKDDAHVEIACGSAMSGFISTDSLFMTLTLRNGWWQITGATEISA